MTAQAKAHFYVKRTAFSSFFIYRVRRRLGLEVHRKPLLRVFPVARQLRLQETRHLEIPIAAIEDVFMIDPWATRRKPTEQESVEFERMSERMCHEWHCFAPVWCTGRCLRHYKLYRAKKDAAKVRIMIKEPNYGTWKP